MSMVTVVLGAFVTGFANTALTGAFAKFLARGFTTGRSVNIAAFCVALGYVAGRFRYSGPLGSEAAIALGGLAGALVALVGLWLWLLRRPHRA